MSDGPGFIFWGLFVACAAIVVMYAAWMWWEEHRREEHRRVEHRREEHR